MNKKIVFISIGLFTLIVALFWISLVLKFILGIDVVGALSDRIMNKPRVEYHYPAATLTNEIPEKLPLFSYAEKYVCAQSDLEAVQKASSEEWGYEIDPETLKDTTPTTFRGYFRIQYLKDGRPSSMNILDCNYFKPNDNFANGLEPKIVGMYGGTVSKADFEQLLEFLFKTRILNPDTLCSFNCSTEKNDKVWGENAQEIYREDTAIQTVYDDVGTGKSYRGMTIFRYALNKSSKEFTVQRTNKTLN